MKNLAYAILDGNLTADPEVKTTTGGKKVSTFSIAIHHTSSKDANSEDVSFIEVEAWDKVGENCAEYLKKGRKVTILGNLKQDRWKSTDGTSRQKWKVIATTVRFDGSSKEKNREDLKKAA